MNSRYFRLLILVIPVMVVCWVGSSSMGAYAASPKGSAVVAVPDLGKQPTDPHYETGIGEWPLQQALNSQLVYLDPDGKLKPGLALSWEVGSDQLTWTFRLRKGAKFHSGNPVTAQDWVYSFYKVVKDERSGPGRASGMREIYEKVWAEDDYMLKVKTKKPYSTMIAVQSIGGASLLPMVVDSKYIEKVGDAAFKEKPSLPGPYKLVKNVIGEYVELEAFEDHWQVPYTKKLKLIIVPESTTRLLMLKTGEVDAITHVSGPAIPEAKAIPGIRTISGKEAEILEMVLPDFYNKDEPSPIHNKRVRQALAHSVDREALCNKLYYGEAVPQTVPSSTSWMIGGDPTIKGYPYDPEKAKKLLAEAGYPKGFDITITAVPSRMDAAMAVTGYWKAIGLNVNLKEVEMGTYLREAPAKKLKGMFLTNVPTMPPDAGIRFSDYYLGPGQMWGFCQDPVTNKKVVEMIGTMDQDKRVKLLKDLSKHMWEELPSRVPLVVRNAVYAVGPKVQEFVPGRGAAWCYPHLLKMKD